MVPINVKVNKDLGLIVYDPIVQSRDQILKVFPLSGPSFTGMLIDIHGASLLFEKRDGMRILIHRDEIAYAAEVVPRGL